MNKLLEKLNSYIKLISLRFARQKLILKYVLSDADSKGELVVLQRQRVGWSVVGSADASFITMLSAAVLQKVFQTFEF